MVNMQLNEPWKPLCHVQRALKTVLKILQKNLQINCKKSHINSKVVPTIEEGYVLCFLPQTLAEYFQLLCKTGTVPLK